jgi:hypothetical protein
MMARFTVPKYLVTFCNAGSPKFCIISEKGIEKTIDLRQKQLGIAVGGGITGAAFHQSQLFLGLQTSEGLLLVLGRDFEAIKAFQVTECKDIHGMRSLGDKLLLISTGSDQVLSFDPANDEIAAFWSDSPSLSDMTHLNDITGAGDKIYCSRFGIRRPNSMRNGEVVEITSGDIISAGLREPHSITAFGQELFVLESPTGDLLRLRKGFAPQRVLGIVGYARGLAVNETHFAIGKSGYRMNSRMGVGDARVAPFAASDAASQYLASSGVFIIERAKLSRTFIDTTEIGTEIYQVTELPEEFAAALTASGKEIAGTQSAQTGFADAAARQPAQTARPFWKFWR